MFGQFGELNCPNKVVNLNKMSHRVIEKRRQLRVFCLCKFKQLLLVLKVFLLCCCCLWLPPLLLSCFAPLAVHPALPALLKEVVLPLPAILFPPSLEAALALSLVQVPFSAALG